jgi:uncharacterized protein (DUF736 family)
MTNTQQSIGALWAKKSAAGDSFLSGSIEIEEGNRINIIVFKNTYKEEGSNQPDFRILLSKPRE